MEAVTSQVADLFGDSDAETGWTFSNQRHRKENAVHARSFRHAWKLSKATGTASCSGRQGGQASLPGPDGFCSLAGYLLSGISDEAELRSFTGRVVCAWRRTFASCLGPWEVLWE